MRRLMVAIPFLALLILAPAACKRRKPTVVQDDGQLVTIVNVADPRAGVQLTRGFYDLEGNAWRWTDKNFAVMLRRPTGGNQNGATLQLKLTLPEVIFNQIGPMAVLATVNGVTLPSETYSKPGDYIYTRDVPASALSAETVNVEFSTDKSLPPTTKDTRELALVVTTIGLLPK
jgi:hypothetical protein